MFANQNQAPGRNCVRGFEQDSCAWTGLLKYGISDKYL